MLRSYFAISAKWTAHNHNSPSTYLFPLFQTLRYLFTVFICLFFSCSGMNSLIQKLKPHLLHCTDYFYLFINCCVIDWIQGNHSGSKCTIQISSFKWLTSFLPTLVTLQLAVAWVFLCRVGKRCFAISPAS